MILWIEIAGRSRKVEFATAPLAGEITCLVDDRPVTVDARALTSGVLSLLLLDSATEGLSHAPHAGLQYRCILDASAEGESVIVNGQRTPFTIEDPRSLRARRGTGVVADGPRAVKAPMPGRVVRILVAQDDEVAAHQGLIVIEAMKMQNELKSPKAGRIARTAAQVGETVQSGDVLIVVE